MGGERATIEQDGSARSGHKSHMTAPTPDRGDHPRPAATALVDRGEVEDCCGEPRGWGVAERDHPSTGSRRVNYMPGASS